MHHFIFFLHYIFESKHILTACGRGLKNKMHLLKIHLSVKYKYRHQEQPCTATIRKPLITSEFIFRNFNVVLLKVL